LRRLLATRCLLFAAACVMAACGTEKVRTVNPAISVKLPEGAESLSFGKVPLGQRAKLEVEIRSVRPVTLTVSGIAMTAKDGVSNAAFSTDPAGPFTVGAGSSTVVEVWFAPSEVRNYVAEMVVSSDDPEHPEERVSLLGEGIEAAIRVVGCLVDAKNPARCSETLVEAPAALEVGTVVAGQAQPIQVTIQNLGVDVLDVQSVGFVDETAASAAGFSIDDKYRRAVAIARLSNQTLQVLLAPPLGMTGEVEARVAIASSDKRTPRIELPLRATVVPNQAPRACLVVREIVSPSGQVREPAPGPVVVEPTETVILDADVRPGCTADPEDGADLALAFALDGPDAYGKLDTVPGKPMRRAFRAEVIGSYTVTMEATDSLGAKGNADENGVPARAVFDVKPRQDIAVELRWAGSDGADLDLHFVRDAFDGIGKMWSDVDDCAILAACSKQRPPPSWGAEPPVTSPKLAIDDQGGASLVETILLNGPEAGMSYWVFAHFYEDRRPGRSSAPACATTGPACTGGKVCSAGKCMPPVQASVRIFTKGDEVEDDGLATDVPLETPCDTWLVARVMWPDGDGPIVVQPFGADVFAPDGASGSVCTAR